MQLVNTDGLALIGPGSEWFWTALSGIVLGVTFIAIYRQLRVQQAQIRDSNRLLRSQAHHDALTFSQETWAMLIRDEGLARVVQSGYDAPDSLSAEAWFRCSHYIFLQVNGWEYLYYQDLDGSIPHELWVGADAYYRGLCASPGLRRFWGEHVASFEEPFRSHVAAAFAAVPQPVPAA